MTKSELKAIIKECLHEELNTADLGEGIFGFGNKKPAGNTSKGTGNKASKVTIKVYNPNGSLQFNHTFDEIPGKMNAEDQLKNLIKDSYNSLYNNIQKDGPHNWMYERTSNPPSSKDTKKGRNYFLSDIGFY
jgi:hypothetical protein